MTSASPRCRSPGCSRASSATSARIWARSKILSSTIRLSPPPSLLPEWEAGWAEEKGVGMVSTPPSASFFAQISQDLMRFGEERPTLQTVVERAVEVVPACDAASVTLRRRRNRTETVAASSDIARQADQLQYDLNEGPCLEAAVTGEPRMSNHLADSEDWPRWGPRAAEIGIHALLGIQLSTDDEVLG